MNIKSILLVAALTLSSLQAYSRSAAEYISDGRSYLFVQTDIVLANNCFSNALAAAPNDPTANCFRALSRLLLFPNQPAGSNFLSRLGVSGEGRDLFNWTAAIAKDANDEVIVPSGVNAKELTALLRNSLA